MSAFKILAILITWTAVVVACWEHGRARRNSQAKYHLHWTHGGGTFSAGPLTEAEFDALVTRIRQQLKEQPGA